MIPRIPEKGLLQALQGKHKVLCLLGPRQVGKTTLMRRVAGRVQGRQLFLNGDFDDDRRLLRPERSSLAPLLEKQDYLFVDEAQNIDGVGRILKIVHDEFPAVRVMATGSSSFDLREQTGEPLTGRQITQVLYPISYSELDPGPAERRTCMQEAMIYGAYPELITTQSLSDKQAYLRQLVADYLLRDIYAQVEVNQSKLTDMLRLLAFQIGSEVSLSEIGRQVGIDTKTVDRYIDLLERAFVVIRLGGFSRNLRKEVSKSQKFYFMDLGIRNAILQAFQPIASRADVGQLWENYLVVERIKRNAYLGLHPNYYFWRTYDRQEIDFIEEGAESLAAYEFKSKEEGGKRRIPALWRKTYPDSHAEIIHPGTAHPFLEVEAGSESGS